jgi:hypothetical protein
MKYVLPFVVLSLLGVAACGVDVTDATTDSTDTSTSAEQLSSPAPEVAASPQAVTCFEVWKCDKICGQFVGGVLVRFGTNVLHEHCSDGTDTVEITHPCGEDCF